MVSRLAARCRVHFEWRRNNAARRRGCRGRGGPTGPGGRGSDPRHVQLSCLLFGEEKSIGMSGKPRDSFGKFSKCIGSTAASHFIFRPFQNLERSKS